jgi:ribosomal protein S18
MSSEPRDQGRRDDRGGRQGGGGGRRFIRARKSCKFCADKVDYIDYKDSRMLGTYIPERGKILLRRSNALATARFFRLQQTSHWLVVPSQ